MQPAYEQYRPACRMISLLTNLEVQLFDAVRIEEAKYMLEQGDESIAKLLSVSAITTPIISQRCLRNWSI